MAISKSVLCMIMHRVIMHRVFDIG